MTITDSCGMCQTPGCAECFPVVGHIEPLPVDDQTPDVVMRNLQDAMVVFGKHCVELEASDDEAQYFNELEDKDLIELMCANQMLVTTINHVGGLTAIAMKVRGFTLAPLEPQ